MKGLFGRLAVAVLCIAGLEVPADAELKGKLAPDFVLNSVSGTNYRLSEYRGRIVLVSFWASWCGDCRAQLKALAKLQARYSDVGWQMFGVSVDRDLVEIGDTARASDVEFPALHDVEGRVSEEYAVDEMPYLVLIDRDGIVRYEHAGFRKGEESEYLEQVRALLAE
jgi:peroxiredoxin